MSWRWEDTSSSTLPAIALNSDTRDSTSCGALSRLAATRVESLPSPRLLAAERNHSSGRAIDRVASRNALPETTATIPIRARRDHTKLASVGSGVTNLIKGTETRMEIQKAATSRQSRRPAFGCLDAICMFGFRVQIPRVANGSYPLAAIGWQTEFAPKVADVHIDGAIKDSEVPAQNGS